MRLLFLFFLNKTKLSFFSIFSLDFFYKHALAAEGKIMKFLRAS